MKKRILVVARHNKVEALRVAAGLTLLSDDVKVDVLGSLEDSPKVQEQRDMLDFAEVPCELVGDDPSGKRRLAEDVFAADTVYVI
jgi:hypothetical protein